MRETAELLEGCDVRELDGCIGTFTMERYNQWGICDQNSFFLRLLLDQYSFVSPDQATEFADSDEPPPTAGVCERCKRPCTLRTYSAEEEEEFPGESGLCQGCALLYYLGPREDAFRPL